MQQITDFHRANLLKLADYLDTVAQANFDMGEYRLYRYDDDEDWDIADGLNPNDKEPECGTVCCAAGSGLLAGIPAIPSDYYWDAYIQRVFGVRMGDSDEVWSWLFHYMWKHVDNTPAGAAKRIRYFLERGVPYNAYAQIHGQNPYMFAEGATLMTVYTKRKLDKFSAADRATILSYMQEGMSEDDAIDYAISCGTVEKPDA